MARKVTVGALQQMQRQATNGHDAAPGESFGADAPSAPNVPEQLAALEIHGGPGSAYDDVVKRLRTRCSLLDIPALDEEIAAEARRRCGMLPEPTAEESDFVDGQTVDDQRPYADEEPDELREPPVEPKAEDRADEAFVEPMEDRLADLDVGAHCTAEMSLSMIRARVAERAMELDPYPSEEEIVAEAERIWESFADNRKGPRVATVNPDGTVRDWRRPDTTPDRGDVTTVHTLTDDEPRFSGAGATDGEAQQRSLFLVPEDRQFNGKLYRDAPELANIAEKLIGEHGFLEGLINCEIRYYWRRKTGVSKGRVKIGYCKRASDLLGHFSGADFIIWLSATTARDGKFTPRQVEAAIFHQLLHIETDDEGNFISARHDFEGFAQEIRHYGTWTEDLKLVVPAFTAAQQMGLFDVDDEGIEDEDDEEGEAAEAAYFDKAGEEMERDLASQGAGVLIHDDGSPLTAEEIVEREAAELRGEEEDDDEDVGLDEDDDDVDAFDPAEDGDEPADPDGPAPDEDDPLTDVPFA